MHTLWSIFKTLTTIPHCSGDTQQLKAFIVEWANKYGYEAFVDASSNIYVTHPKAKLCLQAHYDMVCIGKAPEITFVEEGEYLKAVESSLGADNGIAVALMLLLISENKAVDALFTADEEVGLVGARALDLPIKTNFMLNLDSEEEGSVYIGCAGGVDIVIEKPLHFIQSSEKLYDIHLEGLPGGHSGVDIDKHIPSATALLVEAIVDIGGELASFSGGERRNAIAKSAHATMSLSQKQIEQLREAGFSVEASVTTDSMVDSRAILELLEKVPHGVLAFDDTLGMVDSSINFAMASTDTTMLKIELTLRSMQEEKLLAYLEDFKSVFEALGCQVKSSDYYAPWEANPGEFTQLVQEKVEQHHGTSSLKTMHAGLECGVLQQHLKSTEFVSIGPTIELPHSNSEKVHIPSVKRFEACVNDIIEAVNAV